MVAAAGSDPETTAVPGSPTTAIPIDEGEGGFNSPRATEPLTAAPPPADDPLQQPGGDAWRNYGRTGAAAGPSDEGVGTDVSPGTPIRQGASAR